MILSTFETVQVEIAQEGKCLVSIINIVCVFLTGLSGSGNGNFVFESIICLRDVNDLDAMGRR